MAIYFKTKKEALLGAAKMRKGFRRTLRNVERKEPWRKGKNLANRKAYIKSAIRKVRVVKISGKYDRTGYNYYIRYD